MPRKDIENKNLFHMDDNNSSKMHTFSQLIGMLGDPSLTDEGIEVVLCTLESESNNLKLIEDLKNDGKIVLGIGILPFLASGENVIRDSLERAMQLQQIADGSLLLNKEALLSKSLSFDEVEAEVETVVFNIEDGLRDILWEGSMSIEASTVRDALKDCGTFCVARGNGTGSDRIEMAIQNALNQVLEQGFDIRSSRRLIIKVLVSMQQEGEIEKLQQFISTLPKHIDVIWGVSEYELDENELEIVLLATGVEGVF